MEHERQRNDFEFEQLIRLRSGKMKISEELLELAKNDHERGFSAGQIERYLKQRYDFGQMKILSELTGLNYPNEFLDFLCESGMSSDDMEKAAAIYDKEQDIGRVKALLGGGGGSATENTEPEYATRLMEGQDRLAESYVNISERLKGAEEKLDALGQALAASGEKDRRIEALEKAAAEREAMLDEQQKENERLKAALRQEQEKAGPAAPPPTPDSGTRKSPATFMSLFPKRKGCNIIRLITSGNLTAAQVVQLRAAIEGGLSARQITAMIKNNVPAEKIKAIVEIAVLENGNRNNREGKHG